MGNINYIQWITGNDCCKNNCDGDCNCHKDVCDCENILLEISKLHTDDEILQDEIDDIVDSLSGYATEQWVEEQGYLKTVEPLKTINGESLIGEGNIVISGGSGTTIDAYTKAESDARFQPIGDYLSGNALNGYATEQWVLDKHYISGVDLSDYALKTDIPTSNSAFTNDMGYITEHQPLKTINNQVITGTGNIEITASGGTINVDGNLSSASTNPVANSAITTAINSKLDVSSGITEIVGNVYGGTGSYGITYTKNGTSTNKLIFGIGNGLKVGALTSQIEVDTTKIALKTDIPTSNSAFTNDEHFITSADTVFNNYATTADTYTKSQVYTKIEVANKINNKFWCGTQAEYDALPTKDNNILYLIHS